MAVVITLDFQYEQTVFGRASVELDVEKITRDYGSLESMGEEDWRNVVADAESYAPKGYDGLINYGDSNVESESFDDFGWDEPTDTTAPDRVGE